ncbi:MAG: hypothetical protein KKF46_02895 [Nanoarchaeota archaeon]|nr:hypothetical protein [Nanoarchaeota archaeon]MBU1321280.1 hypothetical protein [Nanoarchaeota archaeon]MBU1597110.1 hypothetical protein [Nanoarchaeota archaeon]MBU2442147.1 hypothetical protein [Nanoarchaeota archaeon]
MTQEKDMIKVYEGLMKKHGLPELSLLDKEFCIGKIEETDYVLRFVVNKMAERLEHVLKILGDILQPESSITSMYEAESFSEDEMKKIFEFFKKVSSYHADLLINDFDHDEESAAKLIIKTHNEWNDVKQEFVKILSKIKDAWKNEQKTKKELGYFG